jgi:RNA polymerase sigma-70 factor (ECF subfamily)
MDLSGEKKIVEEAKKNPEVFGKLYDEFYKPIFNYILRRTSDIEEAQDLASQTFFKALKGLGEFHWQNISFSAWLYRIATNEVNSFYRKRGSIIRISIDKIPNIPSPDTANNDFEMAEKELKDKEEFKKLHQNIQKLSPIYQTIITLRFFEKKKISEICEIVGKPEGTIKSQIYRALEDLREIMEQQTMQPFQEKAL